MRIFLNIYQHICKQAIIPVNLEIDNHKFIDKTPGCELTVVSINICSFIYKSVVYMWSVYTLIYLSVTETGTLAYINFSLYISSDIE